MPVSRFNKSLRAEFIPLIQDEGWTKITSRKFGRIQEQLLQWIAISVDGRGNTKRVLVEFGAQPLATRSISMSTNVGGRFWTGSSERRTLRDEDGADQVVQAMCNEWRTRVCGWMNSVLELSNFESAVSSKEIANPPYDRFYLACLCAERGQMADAESWFRSAKQSFDEAFNQNPYAEWAKEHAELCNLAIASIEEAKISDLLAEWRRFTYDELGLEKSFGDA